jgi:hypothetical protein
MKFLLAPLLMLMASTSASPLTSLITLTHYSDAQCPCSALLPDAIISNILENEAQWGDVSKLIDFNQFFVGDLTKDPTKCIHGEEECVGQRHFACAQGHVQDNLDNFSYWSDKKWLEFQRCSYGTCTGCAAIRGPQCPCANYTTFTQFESNDIMATCAEQVGYDWEMLHACGTGDEGQDLMAASSTRSNNDGITYGADGLAPIFINGKQIKTKEPTPLKCGPTMEEVRQAVCDEMVELGQEELPSACAKYKMQL